MLHATRLTTLATLALAIVFSTGCSTTAKTSADKEPAKAQQDEEYTSVAPLGTRIGRKVKKSEAKKTDEEIAAAQKAMSDLQRAGTSAPRIGGSQ